MLFPTFLEKEIPGGGGGGNFCVKFHVFFVLYAISNIFWNKTFFRGGGGGVKQIVVLASEPVGGRSRATELPCFVILMCPLKIFWTLLDYHDYL